MKFAKAVYCAGVDSWYVRFGRAHGIDFMFKTNGKEHANCIANLVNKSLNRDLRKPKNKRI